MVLQVVQEVVEVKDLLQEQDLIITDQDVPEQVILLQLLLLKEMQVEQDIQYITLLQVTLILLVAEVVEQQQLEQTDQVLYPL
jgi:hypothetical protein